MINVHLLYVQKIKIYSQEFKELFSKSSLVTILLYDFYINYRILDETAYGPKMKLFNQRSSE